MNSTDKIAIGFVVYNSDEIFLDRLLQLINNGYTIYLFDNTPEKGIFRDQSRNFENLKYSTCGKNVGLGYGIANITSNAYYDGFKNLIFFDQDTYFTIKTIEYINQNVSLINNYAAILFTSEKSRKITSNFIEDCDLIINSGSLFNLNILSCLNWHSIKYFVDGVDYDFCLRAKKAGFKIGYHVSTPGYDHIIGQEDKSYYIFKKHVRLRAYNNTRIVDTLNSYIKLIFASVFYFEIKLALKFLFLLSIFGVNQVLVRLLNFFKKKSN